MAMIQATQCHSGRLDYPAITSSPHSQGVREIATPQGIITTAAIEKDARKIGIAYGNDVSFSITIYLCIGTTSVT